MKERHVKLFKQFLKFRGLDTLFAGMYRSYRFPDNPLSFDDYLEKVDSFLVIQEAFDFNKIKGESNFDAKFWANLNSKWVVFMQKADGEFHWGEKKRKNKDTEIPVDLQPVPPIITDVESQFIVKHEWSGLDLVPLKSPRKKSMSQPQPLEIRVCTASGNTVVLSTHITKPLEQFGLLTMDMQADRTTNRLVFVFGKNLTYNVNHYSTDIYAVTHKVIIAYLQKYLNIEFDRNKMYYIRIQEKVWNKEHTRCAVVVTNEYREVER